jgi:hypothetical protein
VLYYGVAVFRQPNFKEETSIWDNLHKKDNSLNVIIKYTRKQKQRAQQCTTNTQYNKEKKPVTWNMLPFYWSHPSQTQFSEISISSGGFPTVKPKKNLYVTCSVI